MSWDVFVQDWGSYESLDVIPDNFEPQPIGLRQDIIRKIIEAEPTADFSDPSWGMIENENFSIEVNLGDSEMLNGFSLHVRGNGHALGCIANILVKLNLKGATGDSTEFFDIEKHRDSLVSWISFRDQIIKE